MPRAKITRQPCCPHTLLAEGRESRAALAHLPQAAAQPLRRRRHHRSRRRRHLRPRRRRCRRGPRRRPPRHPHRPQHPLLTRVPGAPSRSSRHPPPQALQSRHLLLLQCKGEVWATAPFLARSLRCYQYCLLPYETAFLSTSTHAPGSGGGGAAPLPSALSSSAGSPAMRRWCQAPHPRARGSPSSGAPASQHAWNARSFAAGPPGRERKATSDRVCLRRGGFPACLEYAAFGRRPASG